ncbi:MAG: hypothetical protein C4342_04115 [Armatimonadota bacterium]
MKCALSLEAEGSVNRLTRHHTLRIFPWLGWLTRYSPHIWGSWYYLGFWGIVGAYIGFLNVYLVGAGFPASLVGLMSALSPLMMLVFAPFVAAWADRHARRVPLLGWALVAMGIALLALFFAKGLVALSVAYFTLATAYSLVLPLGDGLIARLAAHHGLEYGRMRLWGSLSFALVSVGGGWLWDRIGYAPMFPLAGLLLLLFAPCVLVLEEGHTTAARERFRLQSLWRDRGLLIILLVSLLVGLGLGLTDPFLGLSLKRLGGDAFQIGLLFAVMALAELPTMRLEHTLARRLGNSGALLLGCGLFTLGYGLFALVRRPEAMILASVFVGLGFGLVFVATVRVVDTLASAGRVSTLQSVRNALTFGITPLLASPLGGLVFEHVGQWVYALTAGCMALAGWTAWAGRGSLDPRDQSAPSEPLTARALESPKP